MQCKHPTRLLQRVEQGAANRYENKPRLSPTNTRTQTTRACTRTETHRIPSRNARALSAGVFGCSARPVSSQYPVSIVRPFFALIVGSCMLVAGCLESHRVPPWLLFEMRCMAPVPGNREGRSEIELAIGRRRPLSTAYCTALFGRWKEGTEGGRGEWERAPSSILIL